MSGSKDLKSDNDDLLFKVMSIRDTERKLNKSMREFGSDAVLTIHDVTRKLAKENPELLKQIDDLLDKMDEVKKAKETA